MGHMVPLAKGATWSGKGPFCTEREGNPPKESVKDTEQP